MKVMKMPFFGMLFLGVIFSSCLKDDMQDKVDVIIMEISAETGVSYDFFDSDRMMPIECMKVKFGTNADHWDKLGFSEIAGFTYERGYEYVLRVQRTTLANPPADGGLYTYKLLEILSRKCIIKNP